MTTRRQVLAAAVTAGAALAGCRDRVPGAAGSPSGTAPLPGAVPDVLVVAIAGGLATVHGDRLLRHGSAVATPDGTTLYATAPDGPDRTRLDTVEVATGEAVTRATLPGAWAPRVVSLDGYRVALTPPAETAPGYRPAGRARSRILLVERGGRRQSLDLAGACQPDAFTSAAAGLVVLDWLPPRDPDRYRVRIVDPATGRSGPVLTRDKVPVPAGAEEEMRAEAREAVYSPDRRAKYTLYTHQSDHRHTRDLLAGRSLDPTPGFVHTLDLEVGWAYCLDLPAPVGRGPGAAHTLTLDSGGTLLLVADAGSGRLVAADTETLTVRRVAPIPTGAGPASSASVDDRLYLGIGDRVHVVDPARMAVTASWPVPGPVRGLRANGRGDRLYAGRPGGVAWLDPASGRLLGQAALPGAVELAGVV